MRLFALLCVHIIQQHIVYPVCESFTYCYYIRVFWFRCFVLVVTSFSTTETQFAQVYVFGQFMTFALTLAWLMRRPTNVDTSIDRDMVGLFLRRSGLMKGKTDAGGSSGTVTVYDCLILGILTWGTDSKDLVFCLDVTLYSRLMQLVLYRAASSDRCIPQVMTRTVAVDVLERKKAQRSRKAAHEPRRSRANK